MLWIVATPIGETSEITLRALEIIKNADVILCESTKETSKLLKVHQISGKKYELINEHSRPEDIQDLVKICEEQNVALVSDCGTPIFCDPGADLIRACRQKKIPVRSCLGPSSLMGLLSLSSRKLNEFVFRGFLPAETEARKKALLDLKKENRPIVLMDTPYRLKKMLQELKEHFPQRQCLWTLNLSTNEEEIFEGTTTEAAQKISLEKAEFMILLY